MNKPKKKSFLHRLLSFEWLLKGLKFIWRKIKAAVRRFFTWKGFFKTFVSVMVLGLVVIYAGLWYISNYPNIPNYQPIADYRILNEEANACPDPADPGKRKSSFQGWCDDYRQQYYRIPQGTDFFGLQYDWITALERPVGKKQLVTREYMQRLGYIYDPAETPNANNPADLPIGLTWHYDTDGETKILDVSCAACHSAQITYQGTAIQIDGGPGGHALPSLQPTQFMANAIVSLLTTYVNPFKFSRFAEKVLKDVPEQQYSAAKKKLRKAVSGTIGKALVYGWHNLLLYPTEEGYGRTDGLGRIANTMFGDNITSKNYHIADAPVNYPHLWDIWAFDWVQWMGSVKQAMARNLNEALGTRAKIDLKTVEGLYDNTVMLSEVHCIETTLQHLKPPTWPEDLFGKIDPRLRDEGEQIFKQTCATCHGPFPQMATETGTSTETGKHHLCTTCHGPLMAGPQGEALTEEVREHPPVRLNTGLWQGHAPDEEFNLQVRRKEYWEMIHIPLDYIGTDPTSALNMINYTYDITSVLERIKKKNDPGFIIPDYVAEADPEHIPFALGLKFLGGEVRYKQYREWGLMKDHNTVIDADAVDDLNGFGEHDNPRAWRAYRPRPLQGIWATAPFLHNGSVPSIYQMLLPANERDQVFYLGRKEFDPRNLGIETAPFKGAFEFDTSITGNSNYGHEFNDGLCGDGVIGFQIEGRPGFCRKFTERERLALLEYIKVHDDGPRPDPETQAHCSNAKWPEKS